MDINKISVLFVKDYKKNTFYISDTSYLNYSPVAKPTKLIYRILQPHRSEPLTYIKHKTKELFLYEDHITKKLVFRPLILEKDTVYKLNYIQPLVLYVGYLEYPTFLLYRNRHFAQKDIDYIIYSEIDNKIKISWTKDPKKATVFKFRYVKWKEELNHNLIGKSLNQGLQIIKLGR